MGVCSGISKKLKMEYNSKVQAFDESYIEEENSDSVSCYASIPKIAIDIANVSNRDTYLIVNAVLKDFGLFSLENALDPSKLHRQKPE